MDTHGLTNHPVYWVWAAMLQRCNNPKNPAYKNYGARGITTCAKWRVFARFWNDMGPSYRPGLTLERLDNGGNYEPGNCGWVTRKEQAQNTRMTLKVDTPLGVMTVSEIAEHMGVKRGAISARLKRGWTGDQLFTPVQPGERRISTSLGTLSISETARRAGINTQTIGERLKRGWTGNKLIQPVKA